MRNLPADEDIVKHFIAGLSEKLDILDHILGKQAFMGGIPSL